MANFIDLTGQKFGKLKVINRVKNTKYGFAQWLCECECGNKNRIIVKGSSLRSGKTQSCGCLRREMVSKALKKYNNYDLSGEYGIGYTFKNEIFYFDLEDYNLIKNYCWSKNEDGYIFTKVNNCYIRMHRLVMNCPEEFDVDHIEHDEWDNRKEFLRITTRSQNCMNQIIPKNNTSGVKGVNWDSQSNKWKVRISINGKETHIGLFDNLEEAIIARKEAELTYYGEYRYMPKMKIS